MAKKELELEQDKFTHFLIEKVVKVVPVVRPNSWSHKYQITEDGKDKTNGAYQFNTAITYLSVPINKKTGIMYRPLDNIAKVKTPEFPNEEITEQEFFERLLGLSKGDLDVGKFRTDEKGNRHPDTFWQKLGTVKLRNESNVLDLSVPMDMIRYKVLMLNKNVVAPSPSEKNKKRTYRFMLVDQEIAEVQEKEDLNTKLEAFSWFARIKSDIGQLREIMWLADSRISNTTNYDYVFAYVGKIVNESPINFLKLVQDPHKDSKLLLMRATKSGSLVLSKEKTYQFLDGKDIGPTAQAIKWVENPDNFAIVERLKEQSGYDS
jgi:hypothetical protein